MPVAALKVTPVGNVSPAVSLNDGAGKPEAVSVKLPGVPTMKTVLLALVNAGAVGAPVTDTIPSSAPAVAVRSPDGKGLAIITGTTTVLPAVLLTDNPVCGMNTFVPTLIVTVVLLLCPLVSVV